MSRIVRRTLPVVNRQFATQAGTVTKMSQPLSEESTKATKTRRDLVQFVNKAMDKKTEESSEMYKYLVQCFIDNDKNLTGKVPLKLIEPMITQATMAPSLICSMDLTKPLFEFEKDRLHLKDELIRNHQDGISLEGWLKFADESILKKIGTGIIESTISTAPIPKWERSKEDYALFLHEVVQAKSQHNYHLKSSTTTGSHMKELKEHYVNSVKQFAKADISKRGKLDKAGFDRLIEICAKLPAKHGITMYTDIKFQDMDIGNKGFITMKDFLEAKINYIIKKVSHNFAKESGILEATWEKSKKDYVLFLHELVHAKSFHIMHKLSSMSHTETKQHKQLEEHYMNSVRQFANADVTHQGKLEKSGFDRLIAICAELPAKHGITMYKDLTFEDMDLDHKGYITMNDFLEAKTNYIVDKIDGNLAKEAGVIEARWERSKEDYVLYLHELVHANKGSEHLELGECKSIPHMELKEHYMNSIRQFTKADLGHHGTKRGMLDRDGFNRLISICAELPAKHGITLYKDIKFEDMDHGHKGFITMKDFLDTKLHYIVEKVSSNLAKEAKVVEASWEKSKVDYLKFVDKLVHDKKVHSIESATQIPHKELETHKELKEHYMNSIRQFTKADVTHNGKLDKAGFEKLISICAELPAKHGLTMYKDIKFEDMDIGHKGFITMKDFLVTKCQYLEKKMPSFEVELKK